MQRFLSALAAGGIALVTMMPCQLHAADLGLKAPVTRLHKVHRTAVRVVRDYDGTPIVLRRSVGMPTLDAYVAMRATPNRYLNGQPVRAGAIVR